MLRLFQLNPYWGIPNVSPPCMELEAWLRIAGIPYETANADFAQAPKGKIPYVEIDGQLIGDSTLIIDHLVRKLGVDPDRSLTKAERGISVALRRMMKENFYWVLMYDRYGNDANFETHYVPMLIALVFGVLPLADQQAGLAGLRQTLKAQLHHHGMGRHSAADVHRIGMADLEAVSDFLGDKPFLFGEQPTTADAAVYAHVSNSLEVPIVSPVKDFGLTKANLVSYLERMRARLFQKSQQS